MQAYTKTFNEDKTIMTISDSASGYTCNLRQVYNGELGNYYAFASPSAMPFLRMHQYDLMQQTNSLGYTKLDVENAFKEIENHCKQVSIESVNNIAHVAKSMIEKLQDVYSLQEFYMNVVPLMIVEENENIDLMDKDTCIAKIKHLRTDPSVLRFFFHIVQNCMIAFAANLEATLANSTKIEELTEQQITNQLAMGLEL